MVKETVSNRQIEVPLKSYTDNIGKEILVENGEYGKDHQQELTRRLIIARHDTCQTDMFIITIVPSMDYGGDVVKSVEDFRYLGGGDFTGYVFCSTLEGKFFKAFSYTDGKSNGRLNVATKSQLEYLRKVAPESIENCVIFRFHEFPRLSQKTYTKSSDWPSDWCSHGCPPGGCETCSPHGGSGGSGSGSGSGWQPGDGDGDDTTIDYELGEVIVPGTRLCPGGCKQPINMCACLCDCGSGKYKRVCTCAEYPAPGTNENKDPNAGTGGTNSGVGSSSSNDNNDSQQQTGLTASQIFDRLYHSDGSDLTVSQLQTLKTAVVSWMEKYPIFKEMMEDFVDKGQWVRFSVNPEEVEQNASARFDPEDVCIYFATDGVISNVNVIEDYIHAYQYRVAYYGDIPSVTTIEYEAKMFYDLLVAEVNNMKNDQFSNTKIYFGLMNNFRYSELYQTFWADFVNNGYKLKFGWEVDYWEMGKAWKDPNYSHLSDVFETTPPKLIRKYIIK